MFSLSDEISTTDIDVALLRFVLVTLPGDGLIKINGKVKGLSRHKAHGRRKAVINFSKTHGCEMKCCEGTIFKVRISRLLAPKSSIFKRCSEFFSLLFALKPTVMKIHSLNTGYFKLDGGAMFGVVPKSLWQRTNPADDNNLCTWAMRSLLIEDGNKLILVDTGIGQKQDDKFFSHYYLHGNDSLDGNLDKLGFSRNDITDVFLTHLHFDHVGGAIQWNKDRTGFEPAFNRAKFWSNNRHWKWATEPNPREKASFLKENIQPIKESGQLELMNIAEDTFHHQTPLGFDMIVVDGHTDAQMLPVLEINGKKIVFTADLLPSTGHIPLPYVMGYDTRPLLTMSEKARFLNEAAEGEYILFLEHDPVNECCTVEMTEKGVRLKETGTLKEMIG